MKDKLKILLPVDFSKGSQKAAETAQLMAKQFDIEPVLFHSIKSYWKNWFTSGDFKHEVEYRLQAWQEKYFVKKNKKNLVIRFGNVCENIINEADKKKLDLIMLGSGVHGGASRYRAAVCGSETVRHSSTPVWLSKNNTITKVLCAIDLSKHSKKTLEYAINICSKFKLDLDVIYVYPSFVPPFGMEEKSVMKGEEKQKKQCMKQVKDYLKSIDKKKVKINCFYHVGTPANNILDLADDGDYDLVVMGARGESGLKYLLLGSTTEKVLQHIVCSLLVVK